eukprot:2401681-Amphidinium_carterae.2
MQCLRLHGAVSCKMSSHTSNACLGQDLVVMSSQDIPNSLFAWLLRHDLGHQARMQWAIKQGCKACAFRTSPLEWAIYTNCTQA